MVLRFHLLLVGWLVGLSAGLYKNYRTAFHQNWMEDGSQARIDPMNCFTILQFDLRYGELKFWLSSNQCFKILIHGYLVKYCIKIL